jgi:hypothetical protein
MKKKLLPLAMLAGLAGAASTANALYVNNDGLGETLIYPFYTVEEGQNTYINITNTTDQYKAVKVRFLEAENSAEVLDFNLYLSPHDIWNAAIVPEGAGAKVITRDNSCTAPYIQRPDSEGMGQDGEPFKNFVYKDDGGNSGLDRTREGYVEIIEMGVITDPDMQDMIVHNPDGVPGNCDGVRAQFVAAGTSATGPTFENPPVMGTGEWVGSPNVGFGSDVAELGGLYGYGVIINPSEGSASGYSAVALDGFFGADPAYTPQHTDTGNTLPSLGSAYEVATVIDATTATEIGFTDGWDAVSAVFMHDSISNDFVLDELVSADTDWIVGMPTKRAYVNGLATADEGDDPATPWDDTEVRPPFTGQWTGSACEYIDFQAWDREEAVVTITGSIGFSPQPDNDEVSEEFQICKEVSALSFGASSAVYPSTRINYGVPETGYEHGWARLNLDLDGPAGESATSPRYLAGTDTASGDSVYLTGLPVTGFAVQKFINDQMDGGTLANYASLIEHKYTRNITDVDPDAGDSYPAVSSD